MTHLILERAFDPPRSLADVHEGIRGSGWCFDLYQVAWQGSFLSADGRTMVCSFVAPDVESARVALRKTGADTRRLWAASVHDAPSPGNPNVIVERSFSAPDTFERLKAIVDTKAWCLEQHRVNWARSFLSSDGRRMLCLYEAPDAESVRLAQREAELPVDTVWGFQRIGLDTIPSSS
jgi:Nickel responsive protein SCO4226-like